MSAMSECDSRACGKARRSSYAGKSFTSTDTHAEEVGCGDIDSVSNKNENMVGRMSYVGYVLDLRGSVYPT